MVGQPLWFQLQAASSVLGQARAAFETTELVDRIAALEQAQRDGAN